MIFYKIRNDGRARAEMFPKDKLIGSTTHVHIRTTRNLRRRLGYNVGISVNHQSYNLSSCLGACGNQFDEAGDGGVEADVAK